MKKLMMAVIAGFASCVFGAVEYEFYTGGAASWIQTGDVWRSGAIDSSMTPDEEDSGRITSWLELTVDGPCTVSFDSKLLSVENSYWPPNCELWVDGESQSWQYGYEKASRQSVDVCGGGVHIIRWEVYTYSYWGEEQRSPIEISNVQIQDAPANVTVRFDANGGSIGVSERTFSTSAENYGDLSVPTRGGCEFLGWFTARLGGTRVDESSGVRFNASVLYAQWSIPLKQAVGGSASVDVSADDWSEPWNQWHGVPDESHDGTGAAFGGENAGSLYIQTSGKGTLSFWWKAKSGGIGSVHDETEGKWMEVARVESKWMKSEYSDSDWQKVTIPVSHNGEARYSIRLDGWYSDAGEDIGVLVDEVRWAPAPDSVTVSFDANGGRVSAQPMTFDTYGCYEELPTPTRDGWNFDGWFTAPVGGWRVENGGEVRFDATTLYAHWSIPLDEALGTDLEVWSDQMENSDEFAWYGNPEIETPVGSGAACIRREGKMSGPRSLYASLGGMGTISFWWKTKGDAYGYFHGGDDKGETKSISSSMSTINPETGLFEYLDSKWQQMTIDCRNADEVYWYGNLYDDAADLYIAGLTWTPAPESMEVKFMTGKNAVGKKVMYAPGDVYGTLYEPVRAGYIFGGWYKDVEFVQPVKASDYVPFAGAKAYAKWFRTLASAETPLKFRNNPGACADEFYALYEAADWELVEQTYTDGEEMMQASFGDQYGYAVLETTITGSAFLDFVWGFSSGLGSLSLYVDGKEQVRYSPSFDIGVLLAGDVTTLPNESVRVVLDEGSHTVRWEAVGSEAAAIVDDVTASEIAPAKTIGEWLTRFRKLGCWTPDNLSGLESTYAAAKKSTTPAVRYKAAIEHALTTVLELGEDELVSDTLSQFGFTMHWLNFGVTGSFDYSNPPVLNALVDEAFAKAKVAAETALADLDLIPSTWSGTVMLSASEYPIDEDTAIDYGDVLYLKSMLKGVLGAASWVKAYNVEMDWERLEYDLAGARIPEALAQPSLTGDANWGDPVDFGWGELVSYDLDSIESYLFGDGKTVQKEGGAGTAGSFRTAWYGDKLYLRIAKSEFIADPEDASGSFKISIDLGNGSMQESRSESLEISFVGSDWQSLQEMGLPIDGPWFAESDITDGGWYPVEYQENANDYVWIVDFGVGKGKANEIVSDTTLRFINKLDVSSGNYYALFFGEVSEAKEATVAYSKHSKAASAAANQRKAFDRVRDSVALANSESLVREALTLAQSADSYIVSKRTHDGVCLFNYDLADEVQLQAMREHVATALASLDSVQSLDWRKGLKEHTIAKLESGELKFGCVDNPMNVYLGALFGGRFTQGLIPPSVCESAYVPDLNALNSPTLAGLLPDMTRETWREYLEAFGLAYQYEPVEVPTYGPWGESDAVKNPDKLGPTMLTDMTLEINGMPGAVGDVVAAFRSDTGALCGLGKVMDGSGTLTMACYAPTGTRLHFQVWLSDSGMVNPIIADCDAKSDLTAPTSGVFLSGHALVVSDDKDLTISLRSADWHTVSFNVLPEDPSPAAVFADVKAKIAAVTQGIEFWMPGKTSSLKAIEIGKGYWVNTKVDDVEWTVSGKTDPNAEIALEEGWNLVGYAPEAEGAVQAVLKTALAAKAVDYVTYGVEFYPGGTLKKMEPGKAYWVHATKAWRLVYDEPVESSRFKVQSAARLMGTAPAPTYGPWGESEDVKNPDKLGPTFLTDMAVSVDGKPAAYGDVVAVFRGDTGALCGLGKVMDDSGTLTVVCYAPKGVKLSFKVWVAESDTTVNCRGGDLTAPESGAFHSGHALSVSTTGLSATLVPGEKMEYDTGLIGYAASGMPAGLAYNKTTGKITGAATKPGEYAVKFSKSGVETEEMTIVVTAVPKITVEMSGVNAQSDTNGCKVTGAKEYLVGTKATLTATVPTGSMFEGWFKDGRPWPDEATHLNKSVAYTMGKEDVALVAKFKKEQMSVACTWLSDGVFTAGVAAGAGDGILLDDYVTTESGIKSIAVKNPPTGMAYNSTKRIITGFPNKAGTYTVEITVTAQSGAVEKQTIPLTVEALPAWAVGNFAGWTDCGDGTHGTASLSVTAAGAVSGKFLEHGSNWTFTAKSYDVASVTRGERQAYLINAEAVCGKAKRTVGFTVTGRTVDGLSANAGLVTGDLGGDETVEMWRNVWAEAEPKAHLATIAGKYTYFLTDGKSEPVALPLSLNSSSALLSGTVKVPWQANRSVSFSTTAFASPNGVEAVFYVAPYKSGATTYPEFFERFTLIPESGEREIGKAHRNPGVLASAVPHAKGGNGTVSVTPAGGQVDAGRTVTLTASAKSDSVFVRWQGHQGSRQFVDSNAKLVLTMDGEHDVVAEAVFRLRTSFDTPEVVVDSAAEYALSRISVGVPVTVRPVVKDEENMLPVKWSAQNLPTGLKIDATTGEITGVATAINSKPIVIIATSVADSKKVGKAELAADVKPEALPAWAVGDFLGTVRCADGTHGTASFTVSAAGKVTNGKLLEHGSNWTFTAASYAASSVTRGAGREFVIVADAACNKVKRTVELHVVDCPSAGVAASASGTSLAMGHFGDDELELWRNVWKDADAKGIVAGIAGKYTYFLADGTPLPLNLTSAGVLSGKVNVPARGNASVSFSTTVFASSNGVEAAFYVAPDAKKGYGEIYERFTLVPESGEKEQGRAHRNPGVVAVPESYVSPEGKADTGMGTATVSPAGGQIDAGKTVTVSASPDAKSVFVKWRYAKNGETNFCETAKMTFTMDGEHDVKAWAIFRSKGSFDTPVVAVDDSDAMKFRALELGVQFSAFVTVTDVENMKPVKWSATNLPSGLRINAETGEISGVATAVNSKPVVITATSVADSKKKSTSFTLDIGSADGKPAALPETAVGTFTGFVNNGVDALVSDHVGTFAFTSSDKGALSAKVVDAAGTVSFSGSGFAWSKDGKYGVKLTTTKGEKLELTLDSAAGWNEDQLTGTYTTAGGLTRYVASQRNAFSKAWYFAAEGDETNGWTFAFTTDAKAAALTVTLKADGTTSIAGKLPNGVDKKDKAVTLSVSASGVANVGMMREGAMAADFAPVLTVSGKKKVLVIRTYLWFDRSNEHVGKDGEGVGEAKFVE